MRHRSRTTLYALFAVSGFAGLIYESIWTHYLKLFLGHAAYAQALVLAIFMGGMAAGSWIASRRSGRWRNLLLAYAVTEAAIGLLALVFHETFCAATAFAFDSVLPRLAGSPSSIAAFKWALSAALILPQSLLLGMTFPLMTAGVLRRFADRPGRSLAMLYFTNSIGAAVGVLVSGFVLVQALGLPGTVRFAGFLNLLVAAMVWGLFARDPEAAAEPAPARPPPGTSPAATVFLLASFVTGASSFIYEVAWIRMLSLVLGSSTHAFELMLSAFILGLALGGLWIQRRIDAAASPARTLAVVQVAMGLLAVATLPIYGASFDVMRWLVESLPRTGSGYALFNLSSNGIALAVMLPATVCAGMTLPLITYQLMRLGRGEAAIGAVYAANTVGAIAAVFFATHVGLPLLGLQGLLTFGAGLDVALGLAIAWKASGAFRSRRGPAALSVAGVAAIALTLGVVRLDPQKLASGVFRTGHILQPGSEDVVFHRDGKTATISVIKDDSGNARISTNGKVDALVGMEPGRPATLDESTMILLGVIPMALHPEARTAACIGFGSGLTTHTLLSNPRLREVDTVEIEEQVIRAAELFRPRNALAYTDPRSRIHVDDAKTFFSTHARRYDLIVSEPSNPWVSGVASLFSDEFYARARRHLNEGGLFVQWIQLYEIDDALVVSVLKALERNFSDYAIYAANDVDAIIVARNGPVGEPDAELLRTPSLAPALRRTGVDSVQDLAIRKVGSRASWRGLTSTYPIAVNSDYDPVLDQGASRTRFLHLSAEGLLAFGREPLPLVEMLSGGAPAWERTSVTRVPAFDGSRRAHEASVLRQLVLHPERDAIRRELPPQVADGAAPLASWRQACAATDPGPFPLPSFLFVAERVLPDLTAAERAELWAPLASEACAARLSPRDRAWVEFVLAVSRRDAARMATTSRDLLARNPGLEGRTLRYLLAAGMLGSIASEDRAGADRLWTQYASTVDLASRPLLRLLVARARGG